MFVELFNNPPYFVNDVPKNITVKFNNSAEYILPPYIDAEGNDIFVNLTGSPLIKNLITLVDPFKIAIYATQWS